MKCVICGADHSIDRMQITEDNSFICRECAYNYIRCSICGKILIHGGTTCNECKSKVFLNSLNSYSTKPKPVFHNKINTHDNLNNRYYGLEIEFSNLDPKTSRVLFDSLHRERKIYNKSDASLSCGVEIVTSPCDLYSIRKLIKDMSSGLKEISHIDSYDYNAGIHIHINRKSIDSISLYRLGKLLNANVNLPDRISLLYLSGRLKDLQFRDVDNYCNTNSIAYPKEYKRNRDRRSAVNFHNENTVEFRLFKTVADPNVILSYIDLVNSMLEFSSKYSLKDINVGNFILYLNNTTKNEIIKDKVNKIIDKFKYKHQDNVFKTIDLDIEKLTIKQLELCVDVYERYKDKSIINGYLSNILKDESLDIDISLPLLEPKSIQYDLICKRLKKYYISEINKLKEVVQCA